MFCACKTVSLVAFVALLSAGPAFTQSQSDEEILKPTTAPATVAYVYVQTTKGVNVYDAAANGKLTPIKDSPFATVGQMVGSNGKFFISLGTYWIHTYAVKSNGAIGNQVSEINTQNYDGAECEPTGVGANLDHTGKNLYVQLSSVSVALQDICSTWQSYQIGSNGDLSFLGNLEPAGFPSSIPTFSSNNNFAYSVFVDNWLGGSPVYPPSFVPYTRAPAGTLIGNENFTETNPADDPNGPSGPWYFFPDLAKADPTGHLAVLVGSASGAPPFPTYGGPWGLASYSIDNATGSIASTNNWMDIPTPAVDGILDMEISVSGKLVALAGTGGLQVFHFNGSNPITPFTAALIPTIEVDKVAWDGDNHLFALSFQTGELYVYTATPTSIIEAPGSPYPVNGAYGVVGPNGLKGVVVVPKL
jgi:hypothetical protein